jgi:hypothetical protein
MPARLVCGGASAASLCVGRSRSFEILKGYLVSSHIRPIAKPAPFMRSFALAALMGAAMLAGPFTLAHAQDSTAAAPAETAAHGRHGAAGARMKRETVEQRIDSLHASLKITPDEEPSWTGVAQAMRDNSAAMQKLVAEKAGDDPETLTAVDDLKTYEQFARAHVDGLKNLTSSFETLYKSMPDPQKKIADAVFQNFGRESVRSHG